MTVSALPGGGYEFTGVKLEAVRIAILGDAEPKPEPVFTHTGSAVELINRLDAQAPVSFVASTGDLAHRGSLAQYEAISEHLDALRPPLRTIPGNEELVAEDGAERLLRYVARWNAGGRDGADGYELSHTRCVAGHLLVFASALDGGKEFNDEEIDWIKTQLTRHPDRPAILFVHNAPMGIFDPKAAMQRPAFNERILTQPNVVATFSGHLHMNLDEWPGHVRCDRGVHHVHVPGLERTKRGSRHVPRMRLLTIEPHRVSVQTYNLETHRFEPEHEVSFVSRGRPAGGQ